jgi:hypothetical protein
MMHLKNLDESPCNSHEHQDESKHGHEEELKEPNNYPNSPVTRPKLSSRYSPRINEEELTKLSIEIGKQRDLQKQYEGKQRSLDKQLAEFYKQKYQDK